MKVANNILSFLTGFIFTTLVVLAVFFTCNCAPKPVVNFNQLKPCMAPLGKYKMTTEGTIPPNPELRNMMCPLDIFLKFHQEDILDIQANDPVVLCGDHVVQLPNGGVSVVTTTKEGMEGVVIMPMKIGSKSCTTYYHIKFERLFNNPVVEKKIVSPEREVPDRLPRLR